MEESKQITTMDNFKICRICLNINKAPLEPSLQNSEMQKLFTTLTSMTVESNDGLPKTLCQLCSKKLSWFGEFREQCLKSEKQLQLRLSRMLKYKVQTSVETDEADIFWPQIPSDEYKNDEVLVTDQVEPNKEVEMISMDHISPFEINPVTTNACDFVEETHYDSSSDDDMPLVKRFRNMPPVSPVKEEILDPLQIKIECDEEEIPKQFDIETTKIEQNGDQSTRNSVIMKNVVMDEPPVVDGITTDSNGLVWRVCQLCLQRFKIDNKASYNRHMRQHEICPVIECLVCKKIFKSFSKLQCHEEMKHVGVQMKNISCLKCDTKFARIGNLVEHFRSRHSNNMRCQFCDQWMPENELNQHVMDMHNDFTPIEPICKVKYEENDADSLKSNVQIFKLKCNQCNLVSRTERKHEIHMRKHAVCPEIKCLQCDIEFELFEELITHETDVHSNDTISNYPCLHCKKTFTTVVLLLRHDDVCKTKKAKFNHLFSCVKCSESFAHGSDIMEHYSAERGKIDATDLSPPFICSAEHCSFLAYNECALVHHEKLHQFPKETCQHCGKEFRTKRHFRRHLLIHTRTKRSRVRVTDDGSQDNSVQEENEKACEFCKKVMSVDVIVAHELECVMLNGGHPSTSNSAEVQEGDESDGKESESEDESVKSKKRSQNVDSALKCDICRDSIISLDTYNKHMMHHTILPDIKCWDCDISFDKMIKLRFHERKEHRGKKMMNIRCCKCDEKFAEYPELELHFKKHETKRPHFGNVISCENCNDQFSTKLKFLNHISRLNGRLHDDQVSPPFVCDKPDCRYRSYTLCAFFYHQKVHNSPEFICSVCGMCLSSYNCLKSHELKHSITPKPFFCTKCNTTIEGTTYSVHYTRIHSREQPKKSWWCDLCGKYLKIAKRLHMMVHSGIKPHVCSFCDKSFTIKSDLRDHMDKHTNEKRHQCKTCLKMFSRMQLRFHKKKCAADAEAAAAEADREAAAAAAAAEVEHRAALEAAHSLIHLDSTQHIHPHGHLPMQPNHLVHHNMSPHLHHHPHHLGGM